MPTARLTFASLEEALRELDRLAPAAPAPTTTPWTWPQTLVHCAQSIEFSMTGFPRPRSPLFQRTIGAAAYTLFSWRGRMSHDLGAPIPGAPPLERDVTVEVAVARLRRAVAEFQRRGDALLPHFAYGALSKSEYDRAHAMHLANHFSAFLRT